MRTPLPVGAALLAAAVSPALADDLALKRVMLSSAGVGYYEYEAQVDGAAKLGLDVRLDQVDDVLKSMVVFDDAGGVGQVELPGRDSTAAAFGELPFGPEALASPVDYLNSLRGVAVDVQGPKPMSGRIMGAVESAEPVAGRAGDAAASVPRTRVTLLTADGLRQFVLEDADGVQVSDPALREGIGRALDTLRRDADHDVRHLTIATSGNGRRTVRVGFVAVAPLWKATYRVVLPQAAGSARLQGWAVLENQTGADWRGVSLALQYGNPVTFHQAIYRSYYVQRPEVPVEVLGRLLPDVDTRAVEVPQMALAAPAPAPAPAGSAAQSFQRSRQVERPANMAAPAELTDAAEGADETVFKLAGTLDLPAGHSASVPILDREMPATRLGLVAPGKRHPVSSIQVVNNGPSSLPAGVLTLYDAANADAPFAGDARLGGLPPGESRLLSFAEDLRTAVTTSSSSTAVIASLAASGGVLHVDYRDRRTTDFTLAAPVAEPRHLLLEVPRPPGATLVPDLPAGTGVEETAGQWRIAVDLAAGETRRLSVRVDTVRQQLIALTVGDTAWLGLIGQQGLSDAARTGLQHLADLRTQQAARDEAKTRLEADLAAVGKDEDRLRANLAAVPVGDALHTRLVRQLDADETQIATLTKSIADATQAAAQAQKAFADAVGSFRL